MAKGLQGKLFQFHHFNSADWAGWFKHWQAHARGCYFHGLSPDTAQADSHIDKHLGRCLSRCLGHLLHLCKLQRLGLVGFPAHHVCRVRNETSINQLCVLHLGCNNLCALTFLHSFFLGCWSDTSFHARTKIEVKHLPAESGEPKGE